MSKRAVDFVNSWIAENINAEAYEEDLERARELTEVCLIQAKAVGISRGEIEEDMGDLVDVIAGAMEEATDAEVRRLAAKDD